MVPESGKVVALRRLIDARFPAARRRGSRWLPTGVPELDHVLGGGLRAGALTELVSEVPSGGCQSSLGALLLSARLARLRIALIDAANGFDPAGMDDDAIAHLVWVRCPSLEAAWRAADLAARDPNYAAVAIDVRGYPERTLLRTRDAVWVRLQRAAEQADTAVLIQTTTPLVPNAACRAVFRQPLPDDAPLMPRAGLLAAISVERHRMRAREAIA